MARRTVPSDAPGLRSAAIAAIALAVTLSGIVGAAATTTTTGSTTSTSTPGTTVPAPTTTVPLLPPPPPFPMGDDSGRLLLLHRSEATVALADATADITSGTEHTQLAYEHVQVAKHAQAQARVYAAAVARKLVSIHEQIKVLAAQAYMLGSSPQIVGALSSIASARDVVDLSRNLTFVHSSHDRLVELVDIEHREQVKAKAAVSDAAKSVTRSIHDYRQAEADVADAQQRRTDAVAVLAKAASDQERFFKDATTSASPIMGPTLLTADELVAYIDSLKLDPAPALSVPMRTLAGYYISEGIKEGVRGDVAFAQSILETGAFTFPGHGLLNPLDNNFAGIDACDSCKHGDLFETALLGVRAQIQLLRVYADPALKKITDFPDPVALLHEPRLGSTGHSKTWYSLGGTWATGPNYGFHVYDIYMQMVSLAEQARKNPTP